MEITKNEWKLAGIFALIGFVVSTRFFINFLLGLNPLSGFIVYYLIVISCLFILSKLGLTILKIEIKKPLQIIGTALIVFSFFAIVNWENPLIQYYSTGSFDGASPIFYGTEDGTLFWFWSHWISNITLLRLLVYVISPFALTLAGALLVEKKVEIPAT